MHCMHHVKFYQTLWQKVSSAIFYPMSHVHRIHVLEIFRYSLYRFLHALDFPAKCSIIFGNTFFLSYLPPPDANAAHASGFEQHNIKATASGLSVVRRSLPVPAEWQVRECLSLRMVEIRTIGLQPGRPSMFVGPAPAKHFKMSPWHVGYISAENGHSDIIASVSCHFWFLGFSSKDSQLPWRQFGHSSCFTAALAKVIWKSLDAPSVSRAKHCAAWRVKTIRKLVPRLCKKKNMNSSGG